MAEKNSTVSNLAPNVASALCYVPFIGWVAAIVFLIIEKNTSVRWNAAQSLVLSLVAWGLTMALAFTLILAVFSPVVSLANLVVSLYAAFKTYQGQTVKLPVVAKWADTLVAKLGGK